MTAPDRCPTCGKAPGDSWAMGNCPDYWHLDNENWHGTPSPTPDDVAAPPAVIRQRMTTVAADPVAMANYLRRLADNIETAEGDIVLLAMSVTPDEDPVAWLVQCIVEEEHRG